MREKDKTQVLNVLTAFCAEYMSDPFKKWPDKSDYDAYRVTLSDKPKFAKDNISRIEKFFAWLNSDKETDTMTDNETTPKLFPVDTHTEISHPADDGAVTPIEPEIPYGVGDFSKSDKEVSTGEVTAQPETETTKGKQGRKKGEKRVQVSVYLNPDIYEGIKIMAGNMDATISDILEVFAGKIVERNHDVIQKMKTAWNEVKSKVILE